MCQLGGIMKRRKKFIIAITVILVPLIIVLPGLGSYLVVQDEPQPSDIIVVLMGSGPERMLGAVDLYQAGYAGEIVMVRNMIRGYDLVVGRGIKYNAPYCQDTISGFLS